MPSLSNRSQSRLDTCDPKIISIFEEVIKVYDFSVIFGHRGKLEQNELFEIGRSQKRWPNSKHNSNPARAIDAVPYPTLYESIPDFFIMATYVFAEANKQGIVLEWGGHWKNFKDYAHWQLGPNE